MLLAELTSIIPGFVFRGEKETARDGGCPVIQARDISEGNRVHWEELVRVQIPSRKRLPLVQSGDVLLRAKGHPHAATLVDDPPDATVAASQFFILRPTVKDVLPDYLCWYLNQRPAQRYFDQHSAGTSIKHINKATISALAVEIPPAGRHC